MYLFKGKAPLLIALVIVLATVVVAAKWFHDNSDKPWSLITPSQSATAVARIVELRDKGAFDDAVNAGLHATSGSPNDDVIYQMIATTYLMRSLRDGPHGGDWAKLAAQYSQKALDSNPTDIANAFNAGLNYMGAGDDSGAGGCEYYRKTKAILESLAPHLEGDRAETQGRTIRLAPFRQQHAEALSEVNSRLRPCQP